MVYSTTPMEKIDTMRITIADAPAKSSARSCAHSSSENGAGVGVVCASMNLLQVETTTIVQVGSRSLAVSRVCEGAHSRNRKRSFSVRLLLALRRRGVDGRASHLLENEHAALVRDDHVEQAIAVDIGDLE